MPVLTSPAAHQFIQRYMAANIFMPAEHVALRVQPRRSVGAARDLTNRLHAAQLADHAVQMIQVKGLGKRQGRNGPPDIVKLLDAAHAAAGAARQRATALFQAHKAAAGQLDLHFNTVAAFNNIHPVNIPGGINNAF